MRRKLSIVAVILAALLLIVGCVEMLRDTPSTEGVSDASSVTEESSFTSSAESASQPEETSSEAPVSDEPEPQPPEESSVEPPEESPGGFSPWREEDEPNLDGLKLPAIPEEGFSFVTHSLTLRMGESATVGYEFKPVGATNRTLTWSSSDETVVTVEGGRLTTVGIGKATVRAETAGGRSAECRVTVVAEGTLSTLGALASTLAEGNFNGLQFSKYDAGLDGTAELFLRRIGEGGIPVVTVYREDGQPVLTVSTGTDEEWAIWRRTAGERYILLSYSQPTEAGGTRYVLEEITASGGTPVRKGIFAKETASDGTVTYYHASGGQLTPCAESVYQSERKTYFSNNRQIPDTVLTWVSGQTAAEVDNALRKQKLPG